MENKVKELISKLKKENDKRVDKLEGNMLSDYNRTVTIHKYNYTIEIINQLEKILK